MIEHGYMMGQDGFQGGPRRFNMAHVGHPVRPRWLKWVPKVALTCRQHESILLGPDLKCVGRSLEKGDLSFRRLERQVRSLQFKVWGLNPTPQSLKRRVEVS